MASRPQTWHYGLVARWWAEFNDSGPEIEYFRRFIEENGEPALDVPCGTGRLLLPYLRAGLDVDGCDISADMLALCREQAERAGLSPKLYAQALHELDLPRRYRTIVVCGGFGLGGNREQDVEGLERLYAHLEPGGLLLLDNEAPYADRRLWSYWPKEARAALPEPAREPPDERKLGSDGAEYALRVRVLESDPLGQHVTLEIHVYMWRDDRLVTEEKGVLEMTVYFKDELLLLLERAGFVDVVVRGGYADSDPTSDDDFLVFVARKPSRRRAKTRAGRGSQEDEPQPDPDVRRPPTAPSAAERCCGRDAPPRRSRP